MVSWKGSCGKHIEEGTKVEMYPLGVKAFAKENHTVS